MVGGRSAGGGASWCGTGGCGRGDAVGATRRDGGAGQEMWRLLDADVWVHRRDFAEACVYTSPADVLAGPAFVSCDDDMTLRGRVSALAGPAYIALLLPWNIAGGADSAVGDGAVTSSSAFPSCAAWLDVTSGDESVGVQLRDPCLRAHSECNDYITW